MTAQMGVRGRTNIVAAVIEMVGLGCRARRQGRSCGGPSPPGGSSRRSLILLLTTAHDDPPSVSVPQVMAIAAVVLVAVAVTAAWVQRSANTTSKSPGAPWRGGRGTVAGPPLVRCAGVVRIYPVVHGAGAGAARGRSHDRSRRRRSPSSARREVGVVPAANHRRARRADRRSVVDVAGVDFARVSSGAIVARCDHGCCRTSTSDRWTTCSKNRTALKQVEFVAVRRGHDVESAAIFHARAGRVDCPPCPRADHRSCRAVSSSASHSLGPPSANRAVIIADEPTAELDKANTHRVLDTLGELSGARHLGSDRHPRPAGPRAHRPCGDVA